MGVNSLPKTVTRQRRDCDLNPDPSAPESSTLTTRLPSHPQFNRNVIKINHLSVFNPPACDLTGASRRLPHPRPATCNFTIPLRHWKNWTPSQRCLQVASGRAGIACTRRLMYKGWLLQLIHTATPDTTKLSCLCRGRFGGVNWIPDNSRLSPAGSLKSEHVQNNRPIHTGTPDTIQTRPSCRVWLAVWIGH